jgi:hypothetical protein
VDINPSEKFLQGGNPLSLSVQSAGHALHIFINGQLQGFHLRLFSCLYNTTVVETEYNDFTSGVGSASGTREDKRISYKGDVNLRAGTNKVAILSVACGLPVHSS